MPLTPEQRAYRAAYITAQEPRNLPFQARSLQGLCCLFPYRRRAFLDLGEPVIVTATSRANSALTSSSQFDYVARYDNLWGDRGNLNNLIIPSRLQKLRWLRIRWE